MDLAKECISEHSSHSAGGVRIFLHSLWGILRFNCRDVPKPEDQDRVSDGLLCREIAVLQIVPKYVVSLCSWT